MNNDIELSVEEQKTPKRSRRKSQKSRMQDDTPHEPIMIQLNFEQNRHLISVPSLQQMPDDNYIKQMKVDITLNVKSLITMLEETLPHIVEDGLCIRSLNSHTGMFINPSHPLSRVNVRENEIITCIVVLKEDRDKGLSNKGAALTCTCAGCYAACTVCAHGCMEGVDCIDNIMGCFEDICDLFSCVTRCCDD